MSREKCKEAKAEGAMRMSSESAKTKSRRIVLYATRSKPLNTAIPRSPAARASRVAIVIIALLTVPACHKKVKPHVPIAPRIGATEFGDASWYGYPYHGRRAANGEIYDMEKLTAAHRTLPFDTWVEVRNLANEKTVTVRITDRGPFVDGRIIDVSKAAARAIDLIGPGVARVELTIVTPPPPSEIPLVNLFAVQIGAFRDKVRAERVREEYEQQFGSATVVYRPGAPPVWRVLVGRETSMDAANGLLSRVLEKTQPAFIVRLDDPAPESASPAPKVP
jgi:rare lipoprotein A